MMRQRESVPHVRVLHIGFSALVMLLLLRALAPDAYRAATGPIGGLIGTDSLQYLQAAQRLDRGDTLYDLSIAGYPNPPLIAIAAQPFAALTHEQFHRLWTAFNVLCLAGAALLIAWAAAIQTGSRTAGWVTAFALVAVFRNWPVVIDLGIGNCHSPILFAYAVALLAATRKAWATALVAVLVAGMIKTWAAAPAIALFALAPVGRSLLASMIAAALVALQFGLIGFHELGGFIAKQGTYSVQPNLVSNSIPGVGRLLFSQNPISQPWIHSPVLHYGFSLGLSAAFIIALSFILWRRRESLRQSPAFALASLIAGTLVVLPLCHLSCLMLLMPVVILTASAGLTTARLASGLAILAVSTGAYLVLSLPLPGVNPLPTWATHGWGILVIAIYPALGAALAIVSLYAAASNAKPERKPDVCF